MERSGDENIGPSGHKSGTRKAETKGKGEARTGVHKPRTPTGPLAAYARAPVDLVNLRNQDDVIGPLIETEETVQGSGLKEILKAHAHLVPALQYAFCLSPFLRGLALSDPSRLADIMADDVDSRVKAQISALDEALAPCQSDREAMGHLRRFRADMALTLGLADLIGGWDVSALTMFLSQVADAAVAAGVRTLLRQLVHAGKLSGDAQDIEARSGLIVLAMGKHGARELNYSSDIDLIVFFDPERAPVDAGEEVIDIYVRLTKRLVKWLQERTADGYVYRVDLRLRPDPASTAVAISVPAALQYYESMGQNWERAALIKARPIAGDLAAGEAFLHELAPFVWRKYFDYAALADVQAMKRRIHVHKGLGTLGQAQGEGSDCGAIAGHNIKLGRGGIREIEFYVQTQQLIMGGRNPALRVRGTLAALDALVAGKWVDPSARDTLVQAYNYLRRLEHRLQIVHDEQTHTLATGEEALMDCAALMGFADLQGFVRQTQSLLLRVADHYDALFDDTPEARGEPDAFVFVGEQTPAQTMMALQQLGFNQPKTVAQLINAWVAGRYAATRSERARDDVSALLPVLLPAIARTTNPDTALFAFDQFLKGLPAGVQFFSLLRNNPQLLGLVADVIGAAPGLRALMAARPHVLDAMLDPAFFVTGAPGDVVASRFDLLMSEARGFEDQLDRARIFGQEQMFLIGVRLLSETITPRQAAQSYTGLARILVNGLHQAVGEAMNAAHGAMSKGTSAVLAMGKLGSQEMTATSDLDMILLYEHDADTAYSDGHRAITGTQYYARMTQRLVAALSAPTAEGGLYEVDFRLRPSGRSGPLATRFSAFQAYQQSDAWTWEHMALTRAQVISGDLAFTQKINASIRDILCRKRDDEMLRNDIARMRARIAQEKPETGPFDLKTVAGGIIDVEFIAQYLQLRFAWKVPEILQRNTRDVLQAARDHALVPANTGEDLMAACTLYEALAQVLRLCLASSQAADPEMMSADLKGRLCRTVGVATFDHLDIQLRDHQARVRDLFATFISA